MSQNQIPFPNRKRPTKVRSSLKHKDVVWAAYRWVLNNASCGVAFRELKSLAEEIPDVMGLSSSYTVIVECKVSRADFIRDKKKLFREHEYMGMGDFRFYACPIDLIKKEELPAKWGLIYVNEKGKAICVYNPLKGIFNRRDGKCDKNKVNEYLMMYTALRRLFLKGYMDSIYDKGYLNNSNLPIRLL